MHKRNINYIILNIIKSWYSRYGSKQWKKKESHLFVSFSIAFLFQKVLEYVYDFSWKIYYIWYIITHSLIISNVINLFDVIRISISDLELSENLGNFKISLALFIFFCFTSFKNLCIEWNIPDLTCDFLIQVQYRVKSLKCHILYFSIF